MLVAHARAAECVWLFVRLAISRDDRFPGTAHALTHSTVNNRQTASRAADNQRQLSTESASLSTHHTVVNADSLVFRFSLKVGSQRTHNNWQVNNCIDTLFLHFVVKNKYSNDRWRQYSDLSTAIFGKQYTMPSLKTSVFFIPVCEASLALQSISDAAGREVNAGSRGGQWGQQ